MRFRDEIFSMSTLLVLLFLSTSASGFTIVLTPTNTVRLQTFAPVREPGTTRDYAPTLPRPGTLPETWVVPDTFTFPTKKTKEPNVYRLTLFKSSKHKAEYMEAALIETIGIEATKANEIAKQAQTGPPHTVLYRTEVSVSDDARRDDSRNSYCTILG